MIATELIAFLAGATPPGPKAAPSNARISPPISGKYYLTWSNGDSSAQTRIYRVGVGLAYTVNPGIGVWSTTIDATWQIAHYRNGQESALIDVEET